MALSLVGILLSIVVLTILCFKRINITLASIICAVIVALTSALPVLESIMDTYMTGFGNFIINNFILFALSSLFGKVLEDSGAAAALAKIICRALGKFSVYGCMLATAVLVYGGVSVFVIVFTMFPIFLPVFKERNLPTRLIPGAIFAASCTFACTMMPGTPTLNNLIPVRYLGTTPMAAPAIGLVTSAMTIVLIYFYFEWEFRRAAACGEGFVPNELQMKALAKAESGSEEGNKVLGYLALIPIVVLIVSLNALKLDTNISLLLGTVVGFAVFWRNIDKKADCIENSVRGTMVAIINTASVMGFGQVVRATSGFNGIIDMVTSFSGNPLISLGAATTIIAGATGSGTSGISISMEVLAERFLATGFSPEAMHRVATIATNGLDSLPHNSLVVTDLLTCGCNHKEGYFPIFVTSVLFTMLALIVAVVLGSILY